MSGSYTLKIDSQPIVDPRSVLRSCQDHGFPTDHFAGRATVYQTETGSKPGTLTVLVKQSAVSKWKNKTSLDWSITTRTDAGVEVTTTFQKFSPVLSTMIVPGPTGDPDSVCLMTLADRRSVVRTIPLSKAFNVRSPLTGAMYDATLKAGTPKTVWTWQQLVDDLWTVCGLTTGGASTLPYTPHGSPENMDFYGAASALDCLAFVLLRANLELVYDARTDKFSIARPNADRAAFGKFVADQKFRVWDDDAVRFGALNFPAQVRVRFRRAAVPLDGSDPYTTVSVNTIPPAGFTPISGTYVQLDDDLGTGDFSTRATERAREWERRQSLELPSVVSFPGCRPTALDSLGTAIRAVSIADRGGSRDGAALCTEIACYDDNRLESLRFEPPRIFPGAGVTPNEFYIVGWLCDDAGLLIPNYGLRNATAIPITGTVTSGGSPVAGVTITGSNNTPGSLLTTGTIATTAADGTYSGVVSPYRVTSGTTGLNQYRVQAGAGSGYTPNPATIDIVPAPASITQNFTA